MFVFIKLNSMVQLIWLWLVNRQVANFGTSSVMKLLLFKRFVNMACASILKRAFWMTNPMVLNLKAQQFATHPPCLDCVWSRAVRQHSLRETATLFLTAQGTEVVAQGKRRLVDPHWFRGSSYTSHGYNLRFLKGLSSQASYF